MRAYEIPARVTPEGKLELPDALLKLLPSNQVVRVLILFDDTRDVEEAAWSRLAAEQFLAGYSDADAVCDKV